MDKFDSGDPKSDPRRTIGPLSSTRLTVSSPEKSK
jgi:hypothetical protein